MFPRTTGRIPLGLLRALSSRCFNGFWIFKSSSFDDFLEFGKQKEVTRGQIWRVGWFLQYSYVIFGKKLSNFQGIMSWSIVMTKQPWRRFPQFSSFPPHWAHQTSQDVFVDVLINSLALWQEFCVGSSMNIRKSDQHHLGFLGDNALIHSRLCRLVSGLYSKIHDSSPVTTRFSKLGLVSSCSKMSWHTCTRRSFCPSFSNLGIIFTLIFSNDPPYPLTIHSQLSAIILTVRRRSLCTFWPTRSTF